MEFFRERVRARALLLGTFVKTPSPHVVEVLGRAALDFVVVDGEHSPMDRGDVDCLVHAARGIRLPCLVRTPDMSPSFVGCCLDVGADGVLLPHTRDATIASAAVGAARFVGGDRGCSPSTRAAEYGTLGAQQYLEQGDERSTVWCQIEDADALNHVDDIAKTDGVDCLFIGRVDLARSLGVRTTTDAAVVTAVRKIAAAGTRHSVAVGIHITDMAEVDGLADLGITVFVCGSDQGLLLQQARRMSADFIRHRSTG